MNIKKLSFLSSDNLHKIHCRIYTNKSQQNIKGIIQVVHGMWEHTNSYCDFAKYYTEQGYIVAVHDHLGHGNSVCKENNEIYGHFSECDGNKYVIKDMYKFTKLLKNKYPNMPHFLYAHSMGGLIAINMLSIYNIKYDGIVLLGSNLNNSANYLYYPLVRAGLVFAKPERPAKAFTIIQHFVFSSKFIFSKEGKRWTSRDNEYMANMNFNNPDPFYFTYSAYKDLLKLSFNATPKSLARILDVKTPVLLMTGSDDPVTNYTKLTRQKYYYLQAKGFKDVTLKIYKGARHNLINDTNRLEVLEDMLNFFDNHLN